MAGLKATRQEQKLETLPPPIGGINARDGISIMPPTDAVNLVNWIPDTFGVRSRKGYREWAINFPENEVVQSILTWLGQDTPLPGDTFLSQPTSMPGKLWACTQGGIYDITDTTDSPASAVTLSGADMAGMFSTATVSNIAGTFLCAVSETDGYYTFDGTTWLKRMAGAGAGQISGVDPDLFCFVMQWKRRLWFVERDSTRAWYLNVDELAGTATEFDFGAQFKRGGFISYIANWTIDAGEGVDDFMVIVSSNGEVLVYKGTDPDTAEKFNFVGSFFIGQVPVGRRAFVQYGGDLVLLSANGIYPMSFITRGGAQLLQATGQEYSSMIRSPMGQDLRNSFTINGWTMMLHPSERLLIVGVPDYGGQRAKQFVMSTTQNKWTTFSDIPALCYGESLGYAFAGTTDGRVILLFNDFFDNVAFGEQVGTGIRGVVQPAFSFFKAPALEKQFLMVRPNFLAIDQPSYRIGMSVNFSLLPPEGDPTQGESAVSLWDVDAWDAAKWGGGLQSYAQWTSVGGIGFSGAAGLVTICIAETLLVSLDYMYATGGPM